MASLDPISGPLGKKAAAHLLRRLTFGPTRKEIDDFAIKDIDAALNILLQPGTEPLPPKDKKTGTTWLNPKPTSLNSEEFDLRNYFLCWLLEQMLKPGTSAIEKLTFFLHTHFTTIHSVVASSAAIYYQNQLFRKFAFGNLKDLAKIMCVDNAMLYLLDGRLNVSGRPNENFAREFFELYTLGKEQVDGLKFPYYSENDIKLAAKVLSGWTTDDSFTNSEFNSPVPTGKLKLNSTQLADKHDATVKKDFSFGEEYIIEPTEKIGNFATAKGAKDELSNFVDMVFDQPAAARFFCRKLYRFFVFYLITPEIERDIIVPLANTLVANNFEIKPVLVMLFKSKHFFDMDNTEVKDDTRGALIKSPLEVSLGMLRYFEVSMPSDSDLNLYYKTYSDLLECLSDQGLDLYEPLDVAGYDAYHQFPVFNRNWISANWLARRYQFAELLAKGVNKYNQPTGYKLDVMKFMNNPANISNPADGAALVKELCSYLLPQEITEERFNTFLNILLDDLSTMNWRNEWEAYKATNNDMNVRMQIENLLCAGKYSLGIGGSKVPGILQSPEFQLF